MKYLLLALFLLLSHFSKSQTSKDILDKLSDEAKISQTTSCDFSSQLKNEKSNTIQTNKGSIKRKGGKYKLQMGSYTIISDGQTVWNYNNTSNEVVIDNLEDVKSDFDPTRLFTIWEKDTKHEMKSTNVKIGGVNCYHIVLSPNKGQYTTINLYIDKSKMQIHSVEMRSKNVTINYNIISYKSGGDISDSLFKFEPQKYPGITVIDNRL